MIEERTVDGGDLGAVILRHNPRARHYSLRIRNGQVVGIIPQQGSEEEMLAFLDRCRQRLLQRLHAGTPPLRWDESTHLQTCTFRVHVFRTSRSNFYANLRDGVLHIACPEDTDFEREQVRQLLRTLFTKALRHEAERMLPRRLQMLAARHSFHYAGATVRNTQSRWGSCSSQQRISLSLSLMLLPEHLIDYVLLHELCHTVEMNHGERFWRLLDKVTGNRAQRLRRELKAYRMLPEKI
ncbi:MAG: M48 family metallopeptidase [Tannerella sp.]|jgi:predicted metal-dependent hydrolase|nr:M48 family metallopeptidase [Tannerella sp.]